MLYEVITQSGAPIEIPEKKVVKFKPGAELTDTI